MNLFSLVFVLILAILFTILLLLFVGAMERKAPTTPREPQQTAQRAAMAFPQTARPYME